MVDRTCTALYDSLWIPQFISRVIGLDKQQFHSLTRFSDQQRARIKKELVGLQIQVRHLTYKRKYKVFDLSMTSAQNTRFELKKTDPRGSYSLKKYFLFDFYVFFLCVFMFRKCYNTWREKCCRIFRRKLSKFSVELQTLAVSYGWVTEVINFFMFKKMIFIYFLRKSTSKLILDLILSNY